MIHSYIIVLNYNSANYTIECMKSLIGLNYSEYSIVIIDNKSTDDSESRIVDFIDTSELPSTIYKIPFDGEVKGRLQDKIYYFQTGENNGFASGNNYFIKKVISQEAFIWLVNPDTLVEPDALTYLTSQYELNRKHKIIGCQIRDYNEKEKFISYGAARIKLPLATIVLIPSEKDFDKIDYIYGASMFTHSAVFRFNGFFPEEYFLYWEESDWCYAAKLKGTELQVCKKAIVYDKSGGSIGRGYLAYYLYGKNGLHFLKKYKPIYIPSAISFLFIRIIVKLLKLEYVLAKAYFDSVRYFLQGKSSNF